MESSVITQFEGVINGVKFHHPEDYSATYFILDEIETHFDVSVNDTEFVRDIKDFIFSSKIENENFSMKELETTMFYNIEEAEKLEDVLFVRDKLDNGNNSWNRDINKKIADPTKYMTLKFNIKENSKPTLSISKPKENGGLER